MTARPLAASILLHSTAFMSIFPTSATHNPSIRVPSPQTKRVPKNPLGNRSPLNLPSASLVLYTDGVLDAQSPDGNRFDLTRILESVQGHGESAQTLVDSIVGHINHFRRNRSLPDDLTLVCIQTQTESSFRAS